MGVIQSVRDIFRGSRHPTTRSNPYRLDPDRRFEIAMHHAGDPATEQLLREIEADRLAPGYSDYCIRNLLFACIHSMRPRRVLELGTHIGCGAVMVGSALRSMNYGHLFTLEPQAEYRDIAGANLEKAGLNSWVTICPYSSRSEDFESLLEMEGPFEIIFVDACHEYDEALADIQLCADALYDNGIMILHDSSKDMEKLDTTRKGAVRAAIKDFCKSHADMKVLFLEYPLWLNPCGAAIICKQRD